jgi:hypothetical protein
MNSSPANAQHTFIAPFVAMALNDKPVKNVHAPQNDTKTSDCHMPAIPTILQKGKAYLSVLYNPK